MIERVKYLLELNKHNSSQRSNEWFSSRRNKITASSASALLLKDEETCKDYIQQFPGCNLKIDGKCANPYSTKDKFILEKCLNNRINTTILEWGKKYEPVALEIYKKTKNTEVYDIGFMLHEKYDWLGATPDGLTPDGVLLEIKVPPRRKITDIPPFYYYIQIQLQLETLDLDECDFFDCSFVEYYSNKELQQALGTDKDRVFGAFIEVSDNLTSVDNITYIYCPPDIYSDLHALNDWIKRTLMEEGQAKRLTLKSTENNNIFYYKNDNTERYKIYKCVLWLQDVNIITSIKRNKEWFNHVCPILKQGHDEFLEYMKDDKYKELLKKNKTKIKFNFL
jgi:hypothetical protein